MSKNIIVWILGVVFGIPIAYLLSIVMALTGVIAIGITSEVFNLDEEVKSHDFNIYAFEDNVSYVVSRYGGSDSSVKYYFTRKIDGGLVVGNIPAGSSYIYEGQENPRIEVYVTEPKYLKKIYNVLEKHSRTEKPVSKYKIYIPNNSVTQNYNIDLK